MAKWHRLRLPEDTPALLVQYSSTHQGYELYMTDFISIWSERLSRKDILQRADQDVTTIDPSEDTEQFSVLLDKIGEALCGTGGTTTLSSGPRDTLELITTTELPAPLKRLKWSFHVSKEHPEALTQHLILPLLNDEADWESRQRSLLDQLKQKDWVLGKLFDKIENLGVDLGTVFPSAAGLHTARKGDARSATAKAIKGVAPFDEQAWLVESHGTGLAANFMQEISASEKAGNLDKFKLPQDKWWEKLPPHPRTTASAGPTEVEKDHGKQSKLQFAESEDVETDAGSEDEEFQRQETPPQLKREEAKSNIKQAVPSPRTAAAEADEATATESEAEAEPAPRRRRTSVVSPPKPAAPPPQSREVHRKPRGGLGVIGGKKKKEPPAAAESKPAETKARDATPPSTLRKPTKQPKKLGVIGGKTKAHAPSKTEPTPEPSTVPSPPKKAAKQETPSPQKAAQPKHKEEPPSSPPPSPPSAPPAPEPETEEERANRKREELKRQLQAKSQAPAKKKRRF